MTARRVFAGSVTHAGPCGYKSSENAQTLSTRQICRAVPQAEAHSLQRMRQLSRGTALHSRWAAWSTTRCRAGPSSSPARRKGKKVVFSIARACTNKRTCRSIPTSKKTYSAPTGLPHCTVPSTIFQSQRHSLRRTPRRPVFFPTECVRIN